MNFFKKNYLILPLLLLFTLGISYFSGLFDEYLDLKEKTTMQSEKPYFLKKLDYLSSFIIPSVEEQADFDKLLEAEPTAAVADLSAITTTITQEALKSFTTPSEHPLPLLAHYNTGEIGVDEGLTPDYMITLIEEGNHILPSWKLEPYWKQQLPDEYYKNSILRAKELNLPLTFVIDPIEKTLTEDSSYFTLSPTDNPNVIDLNSNILENISPLGPDHLWSEIGQNFANTALIQNIQEWYPNPPLIMFVDNSSSKKLNWTELDNSQRYIDRYGDATDNNFKRTVIGAQWIEKYRLLHEGIKNSFTSESWKSNTKFIAYNPIALNIGTSPDWENNATLTNQHFSSWPLTTDGINTQYYTDTSVTSLNNNIFNINNLPFVLNEAYKSNSGFSNQLSIADFNLFDTSDKYRGFSQLALWLSRPNIVRGFNSESNDKTVITPHFQSIIDSIELIHNDDRLQNFWKNGELVVNPTASIEQLLNVPSYYASADKWFLLDVDVNPQPEWRLDTHVPVYAIALQTGVLPNREWLLFVQSFDGEQSNISVTIPEYQDVIVNASESGNFYIIAESAEESVISIETSTITNSTSQVLLGNGVTYYLDATHGNDLNNGTSELTPWKSIEKIQNLKLLPGDNILFKRGETWNASHIINYYYPSGTANEPILFSFYGDENKPKPIINSIDTINAKWEIIQPNIWKTTLTKTIVRLLRNNIEILKARTFDELSQKQPWYYENKELFIYSSDDPSLINFSASKYYMTIYLANQNFITINGLEIVGGDSASITLTGSSNIWINNCRIGKFAGYGIYISNSESNQVINNIRIENNVIDSSYTIDYDWITPGQAGASYIGVSDGLAITTGVQDSIFSNNYFINWGHASISMESKSDISTIRNEIFNNTLTSPNMAYGGRLAISGTNVYNNNIHHNLIKNIAVRNQINGHDNHFHHNIIDGVRDSSLKLENIGQCISLEAYNGNVYNNLFEFNIFKNCDGAGIKLISSGSDTKYIANNTFQYNSIFNTGFDTTYASAETDLFIENFNDIKEQIFRDNNISSNQIRYKSILMDIDDFNEQSNNFNNNLNSLSITILQDIYIGSNLDL